MLPHTVTLKNIDAKSLHQQIAQLEALHDEMVPDDSMEANTLKDTVKLLHEIEESLRAQGRMMHHH